MALQDLINKGVCGAGSQSGFNVTKGCPYNFKNTVAIWRTPADFEFDNTQSFTEAYIETLQLAGNLTILKGITDFPEGGTDNLIETLPDNTEIDAGDAKYKYLPVFAQDLWLNKQLGSLEGQGNNRFTFVDSAGNLLMTEGSNATKSRGLLTSRTKRGKLTLQSAGVGAKQVLEFQLAKTRELEDNFIMINQELLTFDTLSIEPIVQANVQFTAVPANAGTTITVSAVIDRGNKGFITGLTTSGDFKVTINGVAEAASVAAVGTDLYTITTTALATAQAITVSLNKVIKVAGDSLYVSNTASTIVV